MTPQIKKIIQAKAHAAYDMDYEYIKKRLTVAYTRGAIEMHRKQRKEIKQYRHALKVAKDFFKEKGYHICATAIDNILADNQL